MPGSVLPDHPQIHPAEEMEAKNRKAGQRSGNNDEKWTKRPLENSQSYTRLKNSFLRGTAPDHTENGPFWLWRSRDETIPCPTVKGQWPSFRSFLGQRRESLNSTGRKAGRLFLSGYPAWSGFYYKTFLAFKQQYLCHPSDSQSGFLHIMPFCPEFILYACRAFPESTDVSSFGFISVLSVPREMVSKMTMLRIFLLHLPFRWFPWSRTFASP